MVLDPLFTEMSNMHLTSRHDPEEIGKNPERGLKSFALRRLHPILEERHDVTVGVSSRNRTIVVGDAPEWGATGSSSSAAPFGAVPVVHPISGGSRRRLRRVAPSEY